MTQIPKINEEYDILYENNYLNQIINDILKDFYIQLQPNCYKMIYNNAENIEESFYNKNNNDYSIYKNLKSSYKISDMKILYNWLEYNENTFSNIFSFNEYNENTFSNIFSFNGKAQHILLKSYIFKFIFSYFFRFITMEQDI